MFKKGLNNIVQSQNPNFPIDFDLYKVLAAYNNKIKVSQVSLKQREEAKLSIYKGRFDSSFEFPQLIVLLEYYQNNK